MRKTILVVLATLIFFNVALGIAESRESDVIQVYVNGKELNMDVSPILQKGRTLVPVRPILEDSYFQ